MGDCFGGEASANQQDTEQTKEVTRLASEKKSVLGWNKQSKLKLPAGSSFGAPFINGAHIQLLTSTEGPGIISYDLKADQWSDNQPVTYAAGALDINDCAYAFNPSTKSLHFIRDNSELMSLDLTTNQLTSVGTVSASLENHVAIQTLKGKVYVLGNEEEKKSSDEFVYVRYDEAMKGIGSQCVTANVTLKGKDYIYIMGGTKAYARGKEAEPTKAPHDEIWAFDVAESKWQRQHMSRCVASCGVINYQNKWLLVFGGLVVDKDQELQDSKEINGLDFSTGEWYRLKHKLPKKGRYFAVDVEFSNIARLLSYGGRQWIAQLDDVVQNMETEDLRFKVGTWNEMGKTVLPQKAKSVKTIGPKCDEDSSDED